MADPVILEVAKSQTKILKMIIAPQNPVCMEADGRPDWGEKQIKHPEQIKEQMILVRVVGDHHMCEVVVVTGEPFEKRPGSWWYAAVHLADTGRIREYSLIDAGVIRGMASWSENYLLDSGFTLAEAEYNALVSQAQR